MKKILAAIITPFNENNTINYELLKETAAIFSQYHLDGIVIASFTGEGPSLTLEEKIEILKTLSEQQSSKIFIQLYASSTMQLLKEIKELDKYSFSGYIITLPHLVQPNQEGILKHFDLASKHTTKSIYIYNAPTRVGCSINLNTILLLSKKDNIVGIINESTDLELIKAVKDSTKDFEYLIADERLLDGAFNHQADGILSTLIHVIPKDIMELITNFDEDINNNKLIEFSNLIADLINLDQSAATLKYILTYNKESGTSLRLPLTSLSKDKKQKIDLIID